MVAWVAQGLGLLVASLFNVKVRTFFLFSNIQDLKVTYFVEWRHLRAVFHLSVPDLLRVLHPSERRPPVDALAVSRVLLEVRIARGNGGHLRLRSAQAGLRRDVLPLCAAEEVPAGDRHGAGGFCRGCDCAVGDLLRVPCGRVLRDAVPVEEQELKA